MPSPLAQQVGEQLYAYRHKAGLTGKQLAEQTGIDQSKISRAENGQRLLTAAEAQTWVKACGGDETDGDRIVEMLVAARVKNPTWADEASGGQDRVQQAYANLAKNAAKVVYVDPFIVPGPLQTPDYARAVLTMSENMWRKGGADRATVDRAVHHRLSVATMFADSSKRFEFVTSTVPLTAMCYLPPSGMLAQIAAISRAVDMGVWLGVIPAGHQTSLVPAGFQMFDGDIRTDTAGELIRRSDTDRRKAFEQRLKAVKKLCVTGPDAVELLDRIAAETRRQL